MADPRETWQRLQSSLQKSRGGGFGGGVPPRAFASTAAMVVLGIGVYGFSNSLFNGEFNPFYSMCFHCIANRVIFVFQLMVVTGPSSIRE